MANAEVYLLDENLNPVPIGVAGEIYVGGVGLARGYLGRPGLTAQQFIAHPFGLNPGSRLYRTGDLGRHLADGALEFLGRVDSQLKISGHRIEPGEVEAALLEQPEIHRCVVIASSSSKLPRLVGYLVLTPGAAILPSAVLSARLNRILPAYMVPTRFVWLSELPINANGKLNRAALPAADFVVEKPLEYVPPCTAMERTLLQVWQKVITGREFGVNDNFFALGGDSIVAIQIIAAARKAGVALDVRQIFEHPTVTRLAGVVEYTVESQEQEDVDTDEIVLTPIQRWFFEQRLADPHHYNQAIMLAIDSQVDVAALRAAALRLPAQHDALRLRFWVDALGDWHQRQGSVEHDPTTWTDVDLRGLSKDNQVLEIRRTSKLVQSSFDLENGPLFKAVCYALGDCSRLLLVCHHLVVDGVSWRILLNDLLAGYRACATGTVADTRKPKSYNRWARSLEAIAISDRLQSEAAYWIEVCRVHSSDKDAQVRHTVAGCGSVAFSVSERDTAALLNIAATPYHTQTKEILLAALAVTFVEWTGSNDILVDVEAHGRDSFLSDVDVTGTVGWFTSIFPLRLSLRKGGKSIEETLKIVKAQIRAIPNSGVGYGILRYMSPDLDLRKKLASIRPLVSFNYLGQFDGLRDAKIVPLPDALEDLHGPANECPHSIEINAMVTDGSLKMRWAYNVEMYASGEIESLASHYVEILHRLINHCARDRSGSCTPADFPLINVDQQTLDSIIQGM